MKEIRLKYIDVYCVDCYFHDLRHRVHDTTNVRLIIDLQKLITQRVPVQRAIHFLRSFKNAFILPAPVQRATSFAQYRDLYVIYAG